MLRTLYLCVVCFPNLCVQKACVWNASEFVPLCFLTLQWACLCVWWPVSESTCVALYGWPESTCAHTHTHKSIPTTYPSSLLSDPGGNVFPDKLQYPANDVLDDFKVVLSQCLREEEQRELSLSSSFYILCTVNFLYRKQR